MHFLGLKDDLLTAHRNPGNEAWRENCRAKTTAERGEASVVWEQELDRQETIVSRATIHRVPGPFTIYISAPFIFLGGF